MGGKNWRFAKTRDGERAGEGSKKKIRRRTVLEEDGAEMKEAVLGGDKI